MAPSAVEMPADGVLELRFSSDIAIELLQAALSVRVFDQWDEKKALWLPLAMRIFLIARVR